MAGSFSVARLPRLTVGQRSSSVLASQLRDGGHARALLCVGSSSLEASGHLGAVVESCSQLGITLDVEHIPGEPSPEIIDAIVSRYWSKDVTAVAAAGGGSVIDSGKAVSAMIAESRHIGRPVQVTDFLEGVGTQVPSGIRLPLFAVPTTAGTGSEATKNAVISSIGEGGFKKSLRHDAYVPDSAILDGELAVTAPASVTAAAGLDAVTQLLEAYISKKASDFTDMVCLEGLRHAGNALDELVTGGASGDAQMRTNMAYAAYLSGVALANANLGIVHGAASVLGSMHEIPHGVVCGTLLYGTTSAIIDKIDHLSVTAEKLASAGYLLSGRDIEKNRIEQGLDLLLSRLHSFQERFPLKRLGDYGFTSAEIAEAAEKTGLKETPVTFSVDQIQALLDSRL
jgi:alcohol dehydrogenase class IV